MNGEVTKLYNEHNKAAKPNTLGFISLMISKLYLIITPITPF